jgi:hypothetical protein
MPDVDQLIDRQWGCGARLRGTRRDRRRGQRRQNGQWHRRCQSHRKTS